MITSVRANHLTCFGLIYFSAADMAVSSHPSEWHNSTGSESISSAAVFCNAIFLRTDHCYWVLVLMEAVYLFFSPVTSCFEVKKMCALCHRNENVYFGISPHCASSLWGRFPNQEVVNIPGINQEGGHFKRKQTFTGDTLRCQAACILTLKRTNILFILFIFINW